MSTSPSRAIDFATLLYRQLPAVWRERDKGPDGPDGRPLPGDLALLMSDWGDLLDALYRTLQQRYYDIFPETEGAPDAEGLARGCQDWVLPYIAQLLDVKLVSPLDGGQRRELAHAVEWRQRKGSPLVIEDIAEAVAALEVEVQEGWRIVALTPRAGFPLLPADVFGAPPIDATPSSPARRAEHPGLPGGTIDFRRASRAIASAAGTPGSKRSTFGGVAADWRQGSPQGAPCFPGSFQDASVRTVDLRTPDSHRGHVHPRRVLLHAAPFAGFFDAAAPTVRWAAIRSAVLANTALPAGLPLCLESRRDHASGRETRVLGGLGATPVRLHGAVSLRPGDAATLPDSWAFENLCFDNRLEIGGSAVSFEACAVRALYIRAADTPANAAVSARSSLFGRLLAPTRRARLEYVTVLERLVVEELDASDCLFAGPLKKDLAARDKDVPARGCVRFSRIPHLPGGADDPAWRADRRPAALKVFADSCTTLAPIFWNVHFGTPGCGVLHPDSDKALRFGAEDGGEMGACHDFAYTLREQAVLEKLKDTLPVGIEALLVPDPSLGSVPPSLRPPLDEASR